LDADFELANCGPWEPSQALKEVLETVSKEAERLLAPGDILVEGDIQVPPGTVGRAWCPTPSAIARLEAAGATPEESPSLEILKAVNDRAFSASMGQTLSGAGFVVDLQSVRKIMRRRQVPWLLKRAFGAAGRGQRRVGPGALSDAEVAWVEASLREGGLQVEPLVDLEIELVIHGLLHPDGSVEIHEPMVQECDEWGTWLKTRAPREGELSPFEAAQLDQSAFLVAGSLAKAGYFGPFGVDAYRWVKGSGERLLNPRGEINARYTMGWGLNLGRVSP
jgi:hypothetical protein